MSLDQWLAIPSPAPPGEDPRKPETFDNWIPEEFLENFNGC
jgi:hypothetical protein